MGIKLLPGFFEVGLYPAREKAPVFIFRKEGAVLVGAGDMSIPQDCRG
jgi:hypothetical protein